MLERVVQVSRAAAGLRQEEVYRIIRTAHAANTLAGLSGGLILVDGWFAQVLEGAPGPAFDACLDPALIEGFGWRPGFPVEDFPADVLVEFVVRACHRAPAPRAPLRAVS
jgi:hypothetical protein